MTDTIQTPANPERRSFFGKIISLFMGLALVVGYGSFAAIAMRFLYPATARKKGWLFVGDVKRIAKGEALSYESPEGTKIQIARTGASGTVNDFIALSSTCPHLGCQVEWQGHKDRFFCPCHNGVFNPSGVATAGPPADAKQSLETYPLRVERNLLFIEVPLEKLKGMNAGIKPAGGFMKSGPVH